MVKSKEKRKKKITLKKKKTDWAPAWGSCPEHALNAGNDFFAICRFCKTSPGPDNFSLVSFHHLLWILKCSLLQNNDWNFLVNVVFWHIFLTITLFFLVGLSEETGPCLGLLLCPSTQFGIGLWCPSVHWYVQCPGFSIYTRDVNIKLRCSGHWRI
jgi:hypothetical protein